MCSGRAGGGRVAARGSFVVCFIMASCWVSLRDGVVRVFRSSSLPRFESKIFHFPYSEVGGSALSFKLPRR